MSSMPQPSTIDGHVQVNINGPDSTGKFKERKFDAPGLGILELADDGTLKFPTEIWVLITGPGIDTKGTMVCTNETGQIALGSMNLQVGRLYIVKYDKPSATTPPSKTDPPKSVTITIDGPNGAGIFSEQKFQAPFPGRVGPVIFGANARLTFSDTDVDVSIVVSGPGIHEPKSLIAKQGVGVMLRSVGMVDKNPPLKYTIDIQCPK